MKKPSKRFVENLSAVIVCALIAIFVVLFLTKVIAPILEIDPAVEFQ